MLKILVVDDNDVNVKLYERVIMNIPGTQAVCFTDPAEALQWCKQEAPALAVVDYRMPGTDGLGFIRRLRSAKITARVPVIMLTGVDDPALKRQAMAGGAQIFLTKPVNKAQFLSAIMHLLPGTTPVPT